MNDKTPDTGEYQQHVWSGGINFASVDLIAMVVSDAGLASTEPERWNASPLGYVLIGTQPRGGWRILQRAVQWGNDHWARCFGVDCKLSVLYAYFACTIRNRIEVWRSDNFISPMGELPALLSGIVQSNIMTTKHIEGEKQMRPATTVTEVEVTSTTSTKNSPAILPQIDVISKVETHQDALVGEPLTVTKSVKSDDSGWNIIDRGVRGIFSVHRPTKLLDGSRGGQAFMCSLLCPQKGKAYGVEEQSRLQLLSVVMVVAGLSVTDDYGEFLRVMQDDFSVGMHLSSIFHRMFPCLVLANFAVLGLSSSVFYALWWHNVYGHAAPCVIQLCSLASWACGAMGLLMLGGNPRVVVDKSKPAARHIQERLDASAADYMTLSFGSLHGSVFVQDRGTCVVPAALVQSICRWRLVPQRSWYWRCGMLWFLLYLLISIVLQIAGSRVATVKSEIMSITILFLTAILRGIGLAGPEEWMIPRWKRRVDAQYAVQLQGQIQSRTSQMGV